MKAAPRQQNSSALLTLESKDDHAPGDEDLEQELDEESDSDDSLQAYDLNEDDTSGKLLRSLLHNVQLALRYC